MLNKFKVDSRIGRSFQFPHKVLNSASDSKFGIVSLERKDGRQATSLFNRGRNKQKRTFARPRSTRGLGSIGIADHYTHASRRKHLIVRVTQTGMFAIPTPSEDAIEAHQRLAIRFVGARNKTGDK